MFRISARFQTSGLDSEEIRHIDGLLARAAGDPTGSSIDFRTRDRDIEWLADDSVAALTVARKILDLGLPAVGVTVKQR
jgi:hypothetical protein